MSEAETCPVCGGRSAAKRAVARFASDLVDCSVCGSLFVDWGASDLNTDPRMTGRNAPAYPAWRAALSYRVRNRLGLRLASDGVAEAPDYPMLSNEEFGRAQSGEWRLPSPPRRMDALVRLIGDLQEEAGGEVAQLPADTQSVIGARDRDDVLTLFRELCDAGLARGAAAPGKQALIVGVSLTLPGWERWEQLRGAETRSKIGFIAMQFGDATLDDFFESVVKPAVATVEGGYSVERIDERPEPGLIDNVIRQRLREAPFVLVEISHGNNGAYWEGGFAEALGKPVVYLMQRSAAGRAHFDVRNAQQARWDWDPDWREERKAEEAERFGEDLRATLLNGFAQQEGRKR